MPNEPGISDKINNVQEVFWDVSTLLLKGPNINDSFVFYSKSM